MLTDIVNTWNELLMVGITTYIVAILFVIITYILPEFRLTIIGAITALIAMSLSSISQLVIKISIVLALVRLILNFI